MISGSMASETELEECRLEKVAEEEFNKKMAETHVSFTPH